MPDEHRDDGLSRREFLGGMVAGAAGLGLIPLHELVAASPERQMTPEELAAWKRSLFDRGAPLLYRPESHPHAALPLGGVGCGNVYLDSGGRLRDWFIFNNLRPLQVPVAFFALRVEGAGQAPVARVLQTTPPPGLPPESRISSVELLGEYPRGVLTCADSALPVRIELEAFTPWTPPEPRDSASPGVVFRFRVRNLRDAPVKVALAGALANAAGGGTAGGNFNQVSRSDGLTSLRLGLLPGRTAELARPARLLTNARGFALAGVEAPRGLRLETTAGAPAAAQLAAREREQNLIWLEDLGSLDVPAAKALRAAVEAGATLLLSGAAQPLLNAWAALEGAESEGPRAGGKGEGAGERADVVFEDWESGTYGKWKVEGTAFGTRPATGTLEGQQEVSGWQGRYLVNSYLGGDEPRGKLTSPPFTIERRFIHFLIGGGNHPGQTCMNLIVEGRTVRTATGKNDERLEPGAWDVTNLQGRRATLEIVDDSSGGWGHINLDQIVFSDRPGAPVPAEVREALRALLPGRFSTVRWPEAPARLAVKPAKALPGFALPELRLTGAAALVDFTPARGAEVLLAAGPAGRGGEEKRSPGAKSAPLLVRRRAGRGQVYLLAAPLATAAGLAPAEVRTQALALLGAAGGNAYRPGTGVHPEDPAFGELCLSTTAEATALPDWGDAAEFWKRFSERGRFTRPEEGAGTPATAPGKLVTGALALHATVPANGEVTLPLYLTWRFPNYYFGGTRVGNRYATFWPSASSAAAELARDEERLVAVTHAFREAIYDSTLPYWLLDCLTSQASTIRSEVCAWLGDGTFAGYEGDGGCCPMNCSHVWGYEQSLAYLFPALERSMREADLRHQQRADGGINNRVVLPLRQGPTGEHPFADGQASGILKAYREYLYSPDEQFLREYWPYIRRAVEYLVRLDGDPPDGILHGTQWNTYDCAVEGPNSFIGSYYLAALRAGEEMAKRSGELDAAAAWRQIFESGQKRLVELCWNGEYFQQNLPAYEQRATQYGPGCLADQLIGQWWAHQLGLGYVLPQEQVRAALRAIFRYNWLPDMAGWRHRQRVFADQHDKGLLCCTWPKGGRPANPILYCDEVWTGVEYQVAAHMIYEGMLEEAFAIVRGARERYDGKRRNPWNEIECGGHYARAMSSWSLLLALSGYHHDGPRRLLAFNPVLKPEQFRAFFSTGSAWGSFAQQRAGGRQTNELQVRHGSLPLSELRVGLPDGAPVAPEARVTVNGRPVAASISASDGFLRVRFEPSREVKAGERLAVEARVP
jgi:uncharacterized protein (DUF608 family)